MNKSSSCKASEKEAERESQKYVDLSCFEDSAESISCCSDYSAKFQELQLLTRGGALDDLYLDVVSPPFQAFGDDIEILSRVKSHNSQLMQPNQQKLYSLPSASLEILRGVVNGKKIHGLTEEQLASPSPLSTNHILELSAVNFIQTNSTAANDLLAMSNPYATNFLALSNDHAKDIQLVQDLLSCAEKVHNQQYDSARKLLEECCKMSLGQKDIIQRLVYYFTEALYDKIERETGKSAGKCIVDKWALESACVNSAIAAFYQNLPLNQATQFASIQLVEDYVSGCRKVHIVDLGIKCGVKQMIIMQALAARSDEYCPLDHLKITAIETNPNLTTEKAGVRLQTLAQSLNLGFSFHIIRLEELLNLQKSPFGLDPEETVVVHAADSLKSMIVKPNELENLMRIIRSISPRVMIVSGAEANVNSPVFVNRFVEALFFYGTYFDYLEDCLKDDLAERTFVESNLFGPVIRNTVATEGEERMFRLVGVNVWRKYFARFGMVEIDLSKLALDHANMVVKRFECRHSCTLDLNGKCLIASWKGTPVCSLSAWKFQDSELVSILK